MHDSAPPPHAGSHSAIAIARVRCLYDGMPLSLIATYFDLPSVPASAGAC